MWKEKEAGDGRDMRDGGQRRKVCCGRNLGTNRQRDCCPRSPMASRLSRFDPLVEAPYNNPVFRLFTSFLDNCILIQDRTVTGFQC